MAITELPPLEQRVLELLYGLGDGNRYTAVETAQVWQIAESNARRVEQRAIGMLRLAPAWWGGETGAGSAEMIG